MRFDSHRLQLTPKVLEQVFQKILGKTVDQAKQMAADLDCQFKLEMENLKHRPGEEKSRDEKAYITKLQETATSEMASDLSRRMEFLELRTTKKVRGKLMTTAQLHDEVISLRPSVIGPRPTKGTRYPHGQGWPTVCPPKGRRADIAWFLYTHRFAMSVRGAYREHCAKISTSELPAARVSSTASAGSAKSAAAGSAADSAAAAGSAATGSAADLEAESQADSSNSNWRARKARVPRMSLAQTKRKSNGAAVERASGSAVHTGTSTSNISPSKPDKFDLNRHCESTMCTLPKGHQGLCSHMCVEGKRRR